MSALSQFIGVRGPSGIINGGGTVLARYYGAVANLPDLEGLLKIVLTPALTAGTLATVLNVTTGGTLSFLAVQGINATSRTHRLKITMDGVVVFDSTSIAISDHAYVLPAVGWLQGANGARGNPIFEPIHFNKSLLVEYASSLTETANTRVGYRYYPQ